MINTLKKSQIQQIKNNKCMSKTLINWIFSVTAKTLLHVGMLFHLTYNAINVIVWYALLPLAWAAILDYKLHQIFFAPCWALLCIGVGILQRKQFNNFCNELFKLSQQFIILFGNYCTWSVIICLLIPIAITILLLLA